MKKFLSLLCGLALATSAYGQATGVFGGYLITTQNGTPTTYREPSTGNASIQALGTSSGTAIDLGTYNIFFQTLTLSGAQVLTFKNGGGDVTGASLMYTIYETGNRPGAPIFTAFPLGFSDDQPFTDPSGVSYNTPGDQRWAAAGAPINLLTASGFGGIGSTNYTLEVFFMATTNLGDRSLNNGGNNYYATFTVVPEPGTYAAALGLAGLVSWKFRRRKQAA